MQKKKKIIYVITKSVWGGAQRYVFDLAANLPKDRFDTAVITSGNGPLIEKLNIAGIRTIILPTLQNKNKLLSILFSLVNFRALFELFKIFKNEMPDIIHLNSSKIGGLGALAACLSSLVVSRKSLVIFTVHGWGFKEARPLPARTVIFFLSWLSTIFQDKIILINKSDFKSAKKFIPLKKLVLIYNGINEINFFSGYEARNKLSIQNDGIVVGVIAELNKNKGLNYLVEAVNKINAECRMLNAKFIIIGGGEDREKLQNRINAFGLQDIVTLKGFVPDAEKFLKAFDIFILPSVKEGLPYVIMAAMQAGLPIIATNIGGIPDMIEHEKNGIVVEPKKSEALANAIIDLAKNSEKRKILDSATEKKSETSFKLRDMVRETIQIYD